MRSLGFLRFGHLRSFAGLGMMPGLAASVVILSTGCQPSVEPVKEARSVPDLERGLTEERIKIVEDEIEQPVEMPAEVASKSPSLNIPDKADRAVKDVDAVEDVAVEPEPLPDPPEKLAVGDASPGLHIAKWVKGDPVEDTLKGKVHVVEFWATWCGPCRVGMPHISSLQEEYADDVTFVGVTRENEAKVTDFLQKSFTDVTDFLQKSSPDGRTKSSPDGRTWDEVIGYRLAIDDRAWTHNAYMRAAGQSGIPCAFVVGRDGVVEWIGHPARIDEPLKKIVEGTWDREAAIAEAEKQQRMKEFQGQINALARSKDWDGALEVLAELEEEIGESLDLLNVRMRILQSAGREEEVSQVRAEIVETAWDDANALNEFAWRTATARGATDLQLALKAATRASELRKDQDAAVLDTVARCHYELGQLDEAIKWQSLAVQHNGGDGRIAATLKRYQKEKDAEQEQATKKP
jgi:thiol-disulfide isomerase/thioredoxin